MQVHYVPAYRKRVKVWRKNLKLKGVSVVTLFFTALESRAENQPEIFLPGAGETFQLINKSGGILMKTLLSTVAVCLVGGLLINYLGAKEPIAKEPVVKTAKPEEIKELTQAHNKFRL